MTAAATTDHPPLDALSRYVAGDAASPPDTAELAELEAHICTCDACADIVAREARLELALFQLGDVIATGAGIAATSTLAPVIALPTAAAPAPRAEPRRWMSAVAPVALAAAGALVFLGVRQLAPAAEPAEAAVPVAIGDATGARDGGAHDGFLATVGLSAPTAGTLDVDLKVVPVAADHTLGPAVTYSVTLSPTPRQLPGLDQLWLRAEHGAVTLDAGTAPVVAPVGVVSIADALDVSSADLEYAATATTQSPGQTFVLRHGTGSAYSLVRLERIDRGIRPPRESPGATLLACAGCH